MHEHVSLRDRLLALAEHGEPVFEPSDDPTLVAFSKLFADSGLFALEASKRIRVDDFAVVYDCETESRSGADAPPAIFEVAWSPVWAGEDPLTGFRRGRDGGFPLGGDSVLTGSTPTVAMPQDERTAALLLLVTTTFVHLEARQGEPVPIVRGAVDAPGSSYRFVTLDRAVARAHVRAILESRRGAEA